MDFKAILSDLQSLLEDSKVGLLSVIDEGGYPHARWMTPAFLPRLPGRVFAVTCPKFDKVRYIEANPRVEWCFQSRTLDRIITLRGRAFIVDEPELKGEVLKAIGPNLQVFWRINPKAGELLVLETEIEQATLFLPLRQETYKAEAPRG